MRMYDGAMWGGRACETACVCVCVCVATRETASWRGEAAQTRRAADRSAMTMRRQMMYGAPRSDVVLIAVT